MWFLPEFNPADAFDWLSTKAEQVWDGGLKLAGLRDEAATQEQPAPQGFYVDALGNRTPIDPETGNPIATTSEKQDILADIRGPAIQALQEQARANGRELPQDFVEYMRFEENPRWCMNGVGVSIFLAKGELNPDVYESIMTQVENGKLEEKAARIVEARQEDRKGMRTYGTEMMLDGLEGMNGKELPEHVREALVRDGKFAYQDEHGNQRMVDFTKSGDLKFMIAEVQELSNNFLNGAPINISESQIDAIQTTANAMREKTRANSLS